MIYPSTTINVVWRDASASVGYTRLHRKSSESIADSANAMDSLCDVLARASTCTLTGYHVVWRYHRSDSAPYSSTPLEYGALLIFETSVIDAYVVFELLSIPDSYIVDGLIDISNDDIVGLADCIIDNGVCNPFGNMATALIAGIPTFSP